MLLRTLRPYTWRLVFLGGTSTASALISAALPWLLAVTVDQLLAGRGITWLTIAYVAFGLVSLVLDAVRELVLGTTRARLCGSLRHDLVRHLLTLGPWGTRDAGEGDLVSRLTTATGEASNTVRGVVTTVSSIVPPVAGVVALFLIDPWLGVVFVAGVPALALLLRAFMRDATDLTTAYQRSQGEIADRLTDATAGRQTIAAGGTVADEIRRVLRPLTDLRRHGRLMWLVEARVSWRGDVLVSTLVYLVVGVAGVRLAAGHLTPGELIAVLQYASMGTGLMGLAHSFSMLSRGRAGATRLAEVLDAPAPVRGTRPLPPGPGRLEFHEVATPVWRPASFAVPAGARVAVVGVSGAGKSLLLAIAGRLTEPDSGVVRLDGVPLDEVAPEALRREISYAFDRPVLRGETVGAAIGFGTEPGATPALVRRAADQACADSFIRKLPGAYDTALREAPFSGGELQRLGLARAFIRDGRLLLLDDALSSLDTATQRQISTVLLSRGGRTTLIATHRADTAARADLVIWLDSGTVRGPAPHHELWGDPGYRDVFAVAS